MSASKTVSRIRSLAQSWPKDPLRPAEHLQLGHAISKNMASLPFTQYSREELEYADKAVSALESIREGRESRAHPLAQHITTPKSDPEYYKRLKGAIQRVQKGEQVGNFTLGQRIRIFFGAKPSQMM